MSGGGEEGEDSIAVGVDETRYPGLSLAVFFFKFATFFFQFCCAFDSRTTSARGEVAVPAKIVVIVAVTGRARYSWGWAGRAGWALGLGLLGLWGAFLFSPPWMPERSSLFLMLFRSKSP
jgi:hypothetical protein